MTPEAQRIAIAEAWGYRLDYSYLIHGYRWTLAQEGHLPSRFFSLEELPDYLSDLNAMRDAEKVLTDEQFKRYVWELNQICGSRTPRYNPTAGLPLSRIAALFRLAVAKRAEAFLRALSLWKEDAPTP